MNYILTFSEVFFFFLKEFIIKLVVIFLKSVQLIVPLFSSQWSVIDERVVRMSCDES